MIIGGDRQLGFEQTAFVDSESGGLNERRTGTPRVSREVLSRSRGPSSEVRECGRARRFERFFRELQFELCSGDAAEIRTKGVRKQKMA
jgi:hypothetical protein